MTGPLGVPGQAASWDRVRPKAPGEPAEQRGGRLNLGPFDLADHCSGYVGPLGQAELAARIEQRTHSHAWLVAEADGDVLGYAYGVPFAARAAYAWACETSVYVDSDRRRFGLGRTLYAVRAVDPG